MNSQTPPTEAFNNILRDYIKTIGGMNADAASSLNFLLPTLERSFELSINASDIDSPKDVAAVLNNLKEFLPTIASNEKDVIHLAELGNYLTSVFEGLYENNNDNTWNSLLRLINWWQLMFPQYYISDLQSIPYTDQSDISQSAASQYPSDAVPAVPERTPDDTPASSVKETGPVSPQANTEQNPASQTSDKAPTSAKNQASGSLQTSQKYWLIKLNYREWDKNFKSGVTRINYTVYENWKTKKQRPGYRLFGQLEVGNLVIGYGYGDAEGIMCLLKVGEASHLDPNPDHGEVVTLYLVQRVKPIIPLAAFDGKYNFTNEFQSITGKRLFKLDKKIYDALLKPIKKADRGALVGLSNDYIEGAVAPDALRFTVDVVSIAAVIAYNKVIPPLAVALLGNWGSGKSFFMQMLRKNIEDLGNDVGTTYCRSVAHIEFNSWHYSDANLWASISAKIFEGLDDFVAQKDTKGTPISLDILLKKLDSASAFRNEQQKALDLVQVTAADLKQQKEQLDAQVKAARATLEGLSFSDMLHSLLNKEEMTSELKYIAETTNVPGLKEAPDIEAAKKTLEDDTKRLTNFFAMVYSVKNPAFWLAIGVTAIFIYGGGALLASDLEWFKNGSKLVMGGVLTIISPLLTSYHKVSSNLKNADDWIRKQYQEMQAKAAAQYGAKMQVMQNQLSQSQQQAAALEKSLNEAKAQEEELRKEIDDQVTGKKLGEFIKGRSTDERYTGSLGMISWIRRDFEQLDKYLKEMRKDTKSTALNATSDNTAADSNRLEIDRIVLYIDDLDRCRGDVVTRVLEAIHLLLAFPLFVVVVGVDPRWMHGALDSTYKGLLGTSDDGQAATSYDYLEKIFQVPFAIAPADENGRKQLIRDQLRIDTEDGNAEGGQDGVFNDDKGTTDKKDRENTTVREKTPDGEITGEGAKDEAGGTANGKDVAKLVHDPTRQVASDEKTTVKPLRLKITTDELDFMQGISFLIGDSPRTIKRYINIYRIVRAHGSFVFEGERERDDYFAAILLAGVMTGQSAEAAVFFQAVAAAPDTIDNNAVKKVAMMFEGFLDDYMKNTQGSRPVALQYLHRELNRNPQLKKLSNISMKVFKANVGLISRFSFRPLLFGGANVILTGTESDTK